LLLDLEIIAHASASTPSGYSEDPRFFQRPNRNHAIARALLLGDDDLLIVALAG